MLEIIRRLSRQALSMVSRVCFPAFESWPIDRHRFAPELERRLAEAIAKKLGRGFDPRPGD